MTVLQQAPSLTTSDAVAIARELYGLEASASPLTSERDQNFALVAGERRFVLKIANALENRELLEAQNAALSRLAPSGLCSQVVPAATGEQIVRLPATWGGRHDVRLLTWIPGVPLGAVRRHTPALLEDLGRRLGELDRALATFDRPALHRDFHWDLARGLEIVRERATFITDDGLRALVDEVARTFARNDGARVAALRRSMIHGDANDHNVLVNAAGAPFDRFQRVTGFIDFGDMVHSVTVADLAIAIAYTALGKRDTLAAAAAVVRGFHQALPLTEDEVAALFGLVKLRLAVSVAVAADQQRQRPGDGYLTISQDAIRTTLPRLVAMPPRFAEATFRRACGWPATHSSAAIVRWIERNRESFAPVVGDGGNAAIVDLSVGSPLVSGDPRENAEPLLSARIDDAVRTAGARVGIGRYGEARGLYTSPLFAGATDADERRTIHLGVDLFAPSGTPVRAPLAGVVHAFGDNAGPLDYGPVAILGHSTDDGAAFFTLYGHLTRESLGELRVGQRVQSGERIGAIGSAGVNGGWPPHVHLQLIVDLLDLAREFPGVCRASERDVWCGLSPDPTDLVGLDRFRLKAEATTHERDQPDGSSSRTRGFRLQAEDRLQILHKRRSLLGRNLSLAYRDPVHVVRGWMQYLYDETGRRYLDAYNNVPHVGHSHSSVVGAAAEQMRVLNTNTRYLHDLVVEYGARLTSTLPDPLRVCYFVNSGSEANELAIRLARAHTKRRDLIVLDHAYHGNTTTLVAISPYKFNGPGGDGAPDWVHVAPLPDDYRGPFKRHDPDAGAKYARAVVDIAGTVRARTGGLCGFIAESAPSVGGQIILPPGYMDAVYRAVRAAGGVCIADEVQTALGRLGRHFYAFESQHVVPDIVVLGKPIGNGHPIGAVITTPAIAASFDNGMEFFSTFGGNTVSCAAGLAVLDVLAREPLQERARAVGDRLMARLEDVASRRHAIGDVRGSGLFIGVELVRDRESLEPATAEATYVVNRLREEGILLGTEGPSSNVLKIRPPMPFNEEDADHLTRTLDRVLDELE